MDDPVAFRYEETSPTPPEHDDALVRIAPNETADTSNPGQYFKDGFCYTCQSGKGGRNAELLQIDQAPRGITSGLIVRFQPFLKCGLRVRMLLLHRSICEALELERKPLLQFRNVTARRGRVRDFFEAVPIEIIPCVVPTSRKGRTGGVCSTCGATFIYHEPKRMFVSTGHANLIRQHGAAAIDSTSDPVLCVAPQIWDRLKKLKASQCLVIYAVRALDEEDVCGRPRFERILPLRL